MSGGAFVFEPGVGVPEDPKRASQAFAKLALALSPSEAVALRARCLVAAEAGAVWARLALELLERAACGDRAGLHDAAARAGRSPLAARMILAYHLARADLGGKSAGAFANPQQSGESRPTAAANAP